MMGRSIIKSGRRRPLPPRRSSNAFDRRLLEANFVREKEQRLLLEMALSRMSQGICMFDAAGEVKTWNAAFLETYGLKPGDVTSGTSFTTLAETCGANGTIPTSASDKLLGAEADFNQRLSDGRYIRISQRRTPDGGTVCTYTDISTEKRYAEELLHRSQHDVLTGLPNRALLLRRVENALAIARRNEKKAAVLLLDIDHFKTINDTMGHAVGDAVLTSIARRLSESVREVDTVARLGGDEFAVLLASGDDDCDPMPVVERILRDARKPVVVEGTTLQTSMSIGVALIPRDGATADLALKAADAALYKAKSRGRNTYAIFEPSKDEAVWVKRFIERDLRSAVAKGQLRLVYQPVVCGTTGKLVAKEALVRWKHPALGEVPPSEFIPIAERTGLIHSIGDWIVQKACEDAKALPEQVKMAVNISRCQLSDQSFALKLAKLLADNHLPPNKLEIEITETALLEDAASAIEALNSLSALGVSIALDDFGVGQSSLSSIRDLPISRIKVDRSFVLDLANDLKARSILTAITSLAHSLGMAVTAEGIETEQQKMLASLAGCQHLQGYLLGRPMERTDEDKAADQSVA